MKVFKKVFSGFLFLAIVLSMGAAAPNRVLALGNSNAHFIVSSASGTYGGTITITAGMYNNFSNTPVPAGKSVTFTLAGKYVGATTTNSSGMAILHNADLSGIDASSTYSTGVVVSHPDGQTYNLCSGTGVLTINQQPLTVSGVTASSKIYNGYTTTTINAKGAAPVGVVGGENITIATSSATGTFADKNVGIGKTVTIAGLALAGTATTSNYSLTQPTATADITAKDLAGSITASNKVYDGTTTATIASCSLSGIIGSEDVGCAGGTATFNNGNVGDGKTVTATGLSLTGADAGNYTVNSTATTTADITVKDLVASVTVGNKNYDNTTAATITGCSLSGVVGLEDVSCAGGTATFNDSNVGNGKTVTATGLSLTGADAGNYTVNSTAATTANITSSGGGILSASYCTGVVYGDWKACASGWQYRDILSQSPANCVLTSSQQTERSLACGTAPTTLIIPTTPIAPITPIVPITPITPIVSLENIANEAEIVSSNNIGSLLSPVNATANSVSEAASLTKYETVLNQDNKISAAEKTTINDYIVYGTPTSLRLGSGERAGVVNSFYQAYGKLPNSEAEWSDVIKVANGRWPSERSLSAENQAKLEFERVYGRNPALTDSYDQNAVMVIAYGLIPSQRNLAGEIIATKTFSYYYNHTPVSALAWNIVRAIAYSGAKR